MNKRYGAAVVGVCGLALLVEGCGGSDKADPATSLPTMTPSATTPSVAPTPTLVDPSTAAKTKVLAAYERYLNLFHQGLVKGGPNFRLEPVMTGEALAAAQSYFTFHKGFRQNRFSGTAKLVSSKVTAINLQAKPATATVSACIDEKFTGTNKSGKRFAAPAGMIFKRDKLKLVGGRWLVYETDGIVATGTTCAR